MSVPVEYRIQADLLVLHRAKQDAKLSLLTDEAFAAIYLAGVAPLEFGIREALSDRVTADPFRGPDEATARSFLTGDSATVASIKKVVEAYGFLGSGTSRLEIVCAAVVLAHPEVIGSLRRNVDSYAHRHATPEEKLTIEAHVRVIAEAHRTADRLMSRLTDEPPLEDNDEVS